MSIPNDEYIKKYEPLWGSWYVEELLGEGSFGKVYKISKEEWGYRYTSALKLISIPTKDQYREALASLENNQEMLEKYFEDAVQGIVNEIRLLYTLRGNSNVISYEDHVVERNIDKFGWDLLIRMEHVTSVTKYVSEHQMTREEVIKLGTDICSALEMCAKKGIIHRDIKDENIFVSDDGVFKLGDFGIARELSKSGRAASMKGTPLFAAPEVFKGETYDVTADLYSLGIVLYRLLNCGRLPFMPPYPEPIRYRDSETALDKRLSGEPMPPPARAGKKLSDIILKACSYSPTDRFISASKMRRTLENALGEMSEEEKQEVVTVLKTAKTSNAPLQASASPQAGGSQTQILPGLAESEKTPENLSGHAHSVENKPARASESIGHSSTEVLSPNDAQEAAMVSHNIHLHKTATIQPDEPDGTIFLYDSVTLSDLQSISRPAASAPPVNPEGTVCLFDDAVKKDDEPQEPSYMGQTTHEPSGEIDGTICLFNSSAPEPVQNQLPVETQNNIPNTIEGTVCLFDRVTPEIPNESEGTVCLFNGVSHENPQPAPPPPSRIDGTVCLFEGEPTNRPPFSGNKVTRQMDQAPQVNPSSAPPPPSKPDTSFEDEFDFDDSPSPSPGIFGRVMNKVVSKVAGRTQERNDAASPLTGGGNIANGSIVSKEGNYLYYCSVGSDSRLYRMNTNGSDQRKICEDGAGFISISGGWIYYSNLDDDAKLYRIRLDGSGRQRLNMDSSFNINILKNWIYYSNDYDDFTLYRINTDGSGRRKICNDRAYNIAIHSNWVYYSNKSVGGKIYRVDPDGDNRLRINHDNSEFLNIVNGWIYYCNRSDSGKIYKISHEGSDRTKLNEDRSNNINVYKDFIYYCNDSDNCKIYRIKTDGTGRTKLDNSTSEYLNILDDWLYFCNKDDEGALYKMRLDGSNKTKVHNSYPGGRNEGPSGHSTPKGKDKSKEVTVDGDWIYL
ncbi:MAG: DUF5050 domain-containing protein [Clostridia bacterium]|nr:DUF5050 domain-containing protein [Clostridia bacterium]